jgi:hypothetical protein
LTVAGETVTPDVALERLSQMSADIRAAVLVDRAGAVAACTDDDEQRSRRYGELVRELFERAGVTAGEPPAQLEAQVEGGAVFAVRRPRWTLAAITARPALASLMFYDLRSVLSDLDQAPA